MQHTWTYELHIFILLFSHIIWQVAIQNVCGILGLLVGLGSRYSFVPDACQHTISSHFVIYKYNRPRIDCMCFSVSQIYVQSRKSISELKKQSGLARNGSEYKQPWMAMSMGEHISPYRIKFDHLHDFGKRDISYTVNFMAQLPKLDNPYWVNVMAHRRRRKQWNTFMQVASMYL